MFITFEGIDGSGKSTQIQLLKEYFHYKGLSCYVFREPGGTVISEEIRKILLEGGDEMNPVTELLLFSSARSQLISQEVLPLIRKGEIVMLDRFYDSTVAYQGYGRQSVSLQDIHQLNTIASHHTVPDVTFYLKLPPNVAADRTETQEKDRMERAGESFFKRVAEGFDNLSKQEERFKTIDAHKPVEQIHQQIVNLIESML